MHGRTVGFMVSGVGNRSATTTKVAEALAAAALPAAVAGDIAALGLWLCGDNEDSRASERTVAAFLASGDFDQRQRRPGTDMTVSSSIASAVPPSAGAASVRERGAGNPFGPAPLTITPSSGSVGAANPFGPATPNVRIPPLQLAPSTPTPAAPSPASSASTSPPTERLCRVFDLSGVWELDLARSDNSQELLLAMGATAAEAAVVDSLAIVSTVTHTTERCVVQEALMQGSTRIGTALTTLELDWQRHGGVDASGKPTSYRATVLLGVTAVPAVSTTWG
jgi:hypothetical protein